MDDFRAGIFQDGILWTTGGVVRLMVRRRDGSRFAYLMADGSWSSVEEGTQPGDAGIVLPSGSLEAIVTAIEEWQGHTSHADTEARVLREWLAVERDRVDAALERD